jgi:hypothetical protein
MSNDYSTIRRKDQIKYLLNLNSYLEIIIAREPNQSHFFNEIAMPACRNGRLAHQSQAGTHLVPLLAGLAMTEWEKGSGF